MRIANGCPSAAAAMSLRDAGGRGIVAESPPGASPSFGKIVSMATAPSVQIVRTRVRPSGARSAMA